MKRILLAMLLASGCDDRPAPTECDEVLCASDEYCRSVSDDADSDADSASDAVPSECTLVPESCGDTPSCECLTDCIECTEDSGVYCEVAAP